jgi:hypothetical protein
VLGPGYFLKQKEFAASRPDLVAKLEERMGRSIGKTAEDKISTAAKFFYSAGIEGGTQILEGRRSPGTRFKVIHDFLDKIPAALKILESTQRSLGQDGSSLSNASDAVILNNTVRTRRSSSASGQNRVIDVIHDIQSLVVDGGPTPQARVNQVSTRGGGNYAL